MLGVLAVTHRILGWRITKVNIEASANRCLLRTFILTAADQPPNHYFSSTAVSTPALAPCSLPPRPREPFPSSDTGSRGWCAPECRRDRYPRFVGQLRWLRRSG